MDSLSDSKAVELAKLLFLYCDDVVSEDSWSYPLRYSVEEVLKDLISSCSIPESSEISVLLNRIESL